MAQARMIHTPLEQNAFRGLYARGGVHDMIPDQFFSDSLNNRYNEGEVSTRNGTQLNISIGNIRRMFMYKRLNETPRFIILDTSGNLFDSLSIGTPIYSDPSFADFSMVNYANRAYITVHDRIKGIPGKKLLVYEGSGTARLAGGDPPSSVITVATSASTGYVETGIHLLAVCYQTSSGFITAPSPIVVYSAPGAHKVTVSSIPVGPPTTTARLIVSSKSIPTTGAAAYNGNPLAYEMFFVPGGTITDNTTTSIDLSYFDADLVDSADYLLDNLTTIPAGLGVIIYSNRLGVWSANGEQFTLRLSEQGQPEVFSDATGFITIDASDAGSGVKNCFEYRKALVICTSNRAATTTDNDDSPNTWTVDWIDKSAGTECFGVATILDARGLNTDRAWIATQAGLVSYEGYFKRPELTWNVDGIWNRINKNKFNLIQVVDDPVRHIMYVSIPLDNATAISHLLVGDYTEAFTIYGTIDEKAIKWDVWTFPTAPVSIVGDRDAATNDPAFHVALSNNIYTQQDGLIDDFGNFIPCYWKSSFKTSRSGWVNHYSLAKLTLTGTGTLIVTAYGMNNSNPATQESIAMSQSPGKEFESKMNYINELCSVKFSVANYGERYTISNLIIMAKELWWHRAK